MQTPVPPTLPVITDQQVAQVVLRAKQLTVLQRHEAEGQHISAAPARMSSTCTPALPACCGTVWHNVLLMPYATTLSDDKINNYCVSQDPSCSPPLAAGIPHHPARGCSTLQLCLRTFLPAASLGRRHSNCSQNTTQPRFPAAF